MKKKQLYPRSIWFFFRNSIGFFALFFFLMIINDYDGDVVWSVDYVVSIMIIIIIIDKQTRLKQKYHNHHHHSHDDDGDHHHQHYKHHHHQQLINIIVHHLHVINRQNVDVAMIV